MAEENTNRSKRLRGIIAVLLVLVVISAVALAVRLMTMRRPSGTPTVVPDNQIGEATEGLTVTAPIYTDPAAMSTEAESTAAPDSSVAAGGAAAAPNRAAEISLYQGSPSDNVKFQAVHMLPGDMQTRYFAVKVSHSADVTVYFTAQVTEQTKQLAEILHIRLTRLESGEVLYDGTLAQLPADGCSERFAAAEKTETTARYQIDASLPTAAGNEYQAARLMADFCWYVKDAGALAPPQTGDTGRVMLYLAGMGGSLAMLLLLLFIRRRDKEGAYAEES